MEAHVSAQAAGATLREKWVGLVVSTSTIQLVPSSSRDLQQNLLSVGRCTLRLFWCWVWEARPFAWGQDMGTWQISKGELSYHSGSRLCGHALCGGLTHSVAWPGSGRLGSCMLLDGPSADAAWRQHGHAHHQGMAFGCPSARGKAQRFPELCPGAYDARWQTESPRLLT